MSTNPARKEVPEALCSGSLSEADLRRFGVFDENDRFVGIRPGVSSDDINPNWRTEALAWSYVFIAIAISRQYRKPDRVRRIAEAMALQILAGVFAVPHYESMDDGETLCFGQFWYLTEEERGETLNRYFDSLDSPVGSETPEADWGINHGLAVIEMFADGLRSVEDSETVRFVRKATLHMITEWETALDDPVLQDALKAIIGLKKFSRKRTLTPDKSTEALTIYNERHTRIRAAKRDYTVHNRRHPAEWLKHVTRDDNERPGQPKIPAELLKQLPHESARSLALQWTATELNQRYRELGATANTVRNLLKISKESTVITAETHI